MTSLSDRFKSAQAAIQPAMITVNNQPIYLTAERKLNVRGTYGPNMLLYDAAGAIIPLDSEGKTEFMLSEGSSYTVKAANVPVVSKPFVPLAQRSASVASVAKSTLTPSAHLKSPSANKVLLKAAARAVAHPYARPVSYRPLTTVAPVQQATIRTAGVVPLTPLPLAARVASSSPRAAVARPAVVNAATTTSPRRAVMAPQATIRPPLVPQARPQPFVKNPFRPLTTTPPRAVVNPFVRPLPSRGAVPFVARPATYVKPDIMMAQPPRVPMPRPATAPALVARPVVPLTRPPMLPFPRPARGRR